MITNTLLIKLKDRKNAEQTKSMLLSMKGKIDELRDIKVEINIRPGPSSYDVLLVTCFSSMEEMDAYLVHPVHVEVSKYIASVVETSAAVCYESIQLPKVIETYFRASNLYDGDTLAGCFSEDAVLYDDGETFRGVAAIKEHITYENNSASVKAEVTNAIEKDGEVIVTAITSGSNFDTLPLDFHFKIKEQRIIALNITVAEE